MSLNRRAFLGFCGKAFVAFTTVSSAAVMAEDKLYVNRKLGLAFRPPRHWRIMNAPSMGDVPVGELFALDDRFTRPDNVAWLGEPFLTLVSETEPNQVLHFFVADFDAGLRRVGAALHLLSECNDPQCEYHHPGLTTDDLYLFQSDFNVINSLIPVIPTTETTTKINGSAYKIVDREIESREDDEYRTMRVKTACFIRKSTLFVPQWCDRSGRTAISNAEFAQLLQGLSLLSLET